jgi:two-component system, LytTR family, response regulator AgrA
MSKLEYKVIVCDDDASLAESLAQRIVYASENLSDDNENYQQSKVDLALVANSFEEVAGYLVANETTNALYFLDIELNKGIKTGIDLAEFIRSRDPNAQIIFVTAYDKYAPLTYRRRIGAIDYINKELPSAAFMQRLKETLQATFDNLYLLSHVNHQYFSYKCGRHLQRVSASEIYYIENSTMQHKVHLVAANGDSEFKNNISKLDEENDFLLKVSQSCVINPDNVVSVDLAKRYVTFPNGDIVYFSRDKKKQIAALGEEQDQFR